MKFKLEWENGDGELSHFEIDAPPELIDLVHWIDYAVGLYRNHHYTLADKARRKICEDLENLIESKG